MRIVELFAGLQGWTSAATAGDVVVTTDFEARFETTITADVLEPDLADRLMTALDGRPDLVLASPPCEAFSVLQIGRAWTRPNDVPPHAPKTDAARHALRIVERTRELIDELAPAYYVIENPRAKLRKLPVVADLELRTVTYCKLGEPFMKPTDLWGGFPPSLELPAPCETRRGHVREVEGIAWRTDEAGRPCHVSAPRGSTTGIQGVGVVTHGGKLDGKTLAALRAKVPLELSRLVIEAARHDLHAGRAADPMQPTLWEAR